MLLGRLACSEVFRQAPADAAKDSATLAPRTRRRGEVHGEDRSRERVGCVNVAVGGGNGFIWLRTQNRVMDQ